MANGERETREGERKNRNESKCRSMQTQTVRYIELQCRFDVKCNFQHITPAIVATAKSMIPISREKKKL